MRTLTLLLAGLPLTLCSAGVLAAPVTCTLGEMTRNIEVVYSDPGQAVPCEVLYDKSSEGTQSTPWRATNESGYCEAKAAELVARLEALGWDCAREATSGSATGSQEPVNA
jgi:hypothetical protein